MKRNETKRCEVSTGLNYIDIAEGCDECTDVPGAGQRGGAAVCTHVKKLVFERRAFERRLVSNS